MCVCSNWGFEQDHMCLYFKETMCCQQQKDCTNKLVGGFNPSKKILVKLDHFPK